MAKLPAYKIEVIHDVGWIQLANVWGGGPAAWPNQWKNFCYVVYDTPVGMNRRQNTAAGPAIFQKLAEFSF